MWSISEVTKLGQRYLELEPENSLDSGRDRGDESQPEGEDEESTSTRPTWVKGALLALLTACGLVFFSTKWGSQATNPPTAQLPTTSFETTKAEIWVDVKGQVNTPGVVRLPAGSRAIDAIKACGGFTEKADKYSVNLAARVQDEQMIRVREIGEVVASPSMSPAEGLSPTPAESAAPGEFVRPPQATSRPPQVDAPLTPAPALTPGPISTPSPTLTRGHFEGGIVDAVEGSSTPAPVFTPRGPRPAPRLTPSMPTGTDTGGPPAPVAKGPLVSINRATVEQLCAIPGMTARLAADIVAYRRGPPPRAFTSLDELNKVPTLTPAKVEEISSHLRL